MEKTVLLSIIQFFDNPTRLEKRQLFNQTIQNGKLD
jgi:hypothetical protein